MGKKRRIRPPKFIKDDPPLEFMGDLETIKRLARGGDKRALAICSALRNNTPLGPGFSCQDVDDFEDGSD